MGAFPTVKEVGSGFDAWLASRGRTLATRTAYVSAVRRAVAAIGHASISTAALDDYAQRLPSGTRNTFRSAWRQFVAYASQSGSPVDPVSSGRLPPLNRATPRPARQDDVAVAYLARAIPLATLARLRWPDVKFLGPADAVIRVEKLQYRVHRRALEVLHDCLRPDGLWIGAVLPDAPNGARFMAPEEIARRAEAGRTGGISSLDPTAQFLAALPPPRVESVDPTDRSA